MSESNGFGRRRQLRRTDPGTKVASPGVGGLTRSLSLPTPIKGLLIGFGVVGLLFATHVVAMKGFGRALDQHWAENVGYPGVEDAYKRSSSAGSDKLLEQVHNDCKSRSDFVGRNRPKSHADVMSGDDLIVGRAVAYLSCLADEKPQRFCQTPHRAHLFAAVKDYYRLKAKVREEYMMMNSGPFAANRNALIGAPTREWVSTTSPMAAESDPRVIGALKRLIVAGYVGQRDLVRATGGWPNDLDLVLRGIEPKQKGCT